MAALDIVNKLRLKHREESPEKVFPPDYEWGTLNTLRGVNFRVLSRHELRNHLEARDLSSTGNKRELVQRLEKSVLEEQARLHADVEEAEFLINADLEERGSVYCVGTNAAGQLGLGDTEPRPFFVVVPQTRGAGVCHVAAGADITFAVTEDHDVLVWGGRGVGPDGEFRDPGDDPGEAAAAATVPMVLRGLAGEETVQVSVGAAHAACVSKGGDVYAWGRGEAGQLGHGGLEPRPAPALVSGLPEGAACLQIECGEHHALAVTSAGEVYAWGHGAAGRLGLGASSRLGVAAAEKHFFPSPTPLQALRGTVVRQVACGPAFCLALAEAAVFSWGSGAGHALGHGDTSDRDVPVAIEALKGMTVLQVAAGTWHAAAVVLVPPLRAGGGYVYTWGSGYHGQLGQGTRQQQPRPAPVEALLATHQFVSYIACGPYHNAVVTVEGELYTWGGNRHFCLGRTLDPDPNGPIPGPNAPPPPFTPDPGHVSGFGALVDGVGRGLPRSVACGKDYTVVATFPYEGAVMEVARQLAREQAVEDEEWRLRDEEEQRQRAENREERAVRAAEARKEAEALAAASRLCGICAECPGYVPDPARENVCAACQHGAAFHTKTNPDLAKANFTAAAALAKRPAT